LIEKIHIEVVNDRAQNKIVSIKSYQDGKEKIRINLIENEIS
jgi:hypothetical protein